jgi:hypothetical protein
VWEWISDPSGPARPWWGRVSDPSKPSNPRPPAGEHGSKDHHELIVRIYHHVLCLMQVIKNLRLFCLLMICTVSPPHSTPQTVPQTEPASERVSVLMHNVLYHFTDQVTAHIFRLEGAIVPTKAAAIPVFDNKQSFSVDITYAEISISTAALTNVMNQYVFAAPDALLKDLSVTTSGSSLKVKGKLHSKGDVPFETEGTLAPTPEGLIRIQTHKVKAAHLPVKGLMDLFGVNVGDLINTKKVAGVRSEGDDLLLDPAQIFPAPHIKGKITSVEIRGDQIVQIYGQRPKQTPRAPVQGNYMVYRGGKLTFGKLTMTDADLILIDLDPRDPFDFFLDHYNDQLVAGYTKNTPQYGLRVYMVDFGKLGKPRPMSPPSKAAPTSSR